MACGWLGLWPLSKRGVAWLVGAFVGVCAATNEQRTCAKTKRDSAYAESLHGVVLF